MGQLFPTVDFLQHFNQSIIVIINFSSLPLATVLIYFLLCMLCLSWIILRVPVPPCCVGAIAFCSRKVLIWIAPVPFLSLFWQTQRLCRLSVRLISVWVESFIPIKSVTRWTINSKFCRHEPELTNWIIYESDGPHSAVIKKALCLPSVHLLSTTVLLSTRNLHIFLLMQQKHNAIAKPRRVSRPAWY